MRKILKRLCYSAVNVVFPLRCIICGDDINQYETIPVCREHRGKIILIKQPFCDLCGRQMFSAKSMEVICPSCRGRKWHFDRAFSATIYTDEMKQLVHFYKYRMRHYMAEPFAELMTEFMQRHIDYQEIDFVVPVPLHWRRYMFRGFNQAYEMIRYLIKRFPLRVSRGNLRRTRHTLPQVNLTPDERRENIKGAFKVIRPEEFRGKSILLVDDVFTTGSTMDECAGTLKEAGAEEVIGFTLTQPVI
jgi:ComF family protein